MTKQSLTVMLSISTNKQTHLARLWGTGSAGTLCWFKILRFYFKGGVPFHHIVVNILIDFWLTVKAATLIFIPGRGSAISSTKEGKSDFIYNR